MKKTSNYHVNGNNANIVLAPVIHCHLPEIKDPELFKSTNEMVASLIEKVRKTEQNMIHDIITKVIGKQPDHDDYKDVSFWKNENNQSKFILAYKGVKLGSIQYHFKNPFRIEFTPDDFEL